MKIRSFFAFLLLIIISSCSKNKKVECLISPSMYIFPNAYFIFTNKTTSKDLFFSPNPTYNLSQISFSAKTLNATGGRQLGPVKVQVDSSRMCFLINTSVDTLFIQIANLTADTLSFISTKSIPNGPCTYFSYADSVKFDGQKYTAGNKQVITLKK